MFCVHGFPPEECILCASEQKLRPKIRLNSPSPSEMPIPVPREDQLLKPKDFPDTDLFSPAAPFLHSPPKLTRKFDLDHDLGRESSTLFDERAFQRSDQKDYPQGGDILEDPYKTGDLIDIRKKFTKLRN